jgi:cysteine sulfinate desulfinase/cysteine desulfurase-like protein
MGLPREWLFGALRVTFGIENSPADVDVLLSAIPQLVASARSKGAIGKVLVA